MDLINIIVQILIVSFSMFWEVLWPLILGFTLSAVVQALVSRQAFAKTLGSNSVKSLGFATVFGAVSSSCSYASVALARSLFQKGASFTSSMVFELSSTNLVIELGIILLVLMGWQFMAAEYLGGVIMVIVIALIFRFTLSKKLITTARNKANEGRTGKMEGHAAMDMSVTQTGSFVHRLLSQKGLTAVSDYFVMDWMSVWIDILLGFLIAGVLAVLVPHSFWRAFFLTGNPKLAFIEGPLIGPLVAIFSFVCSVGNVPLAAVLWSGGISFGGVVSFIFADLIIVPILHIYKKYYGWKVMSYILVTFYIAMAVAGYVVELVFSVLHIIPTNRDIMILHRGIQWNYTSWLNIIFLVVAIVFVYRFIRSGGIAMLRMMNKPEHEMHHQ